MSKSTFKKEDYADFRLNLALRKIGQKVFLKVLKYAVPKPDHQTYHEYYLNRGNFSYKNFDSSQKSKLKNDKTGESFDITLLYKLFVYGCPTVFPQDHVKWKTEGEFDYYLGKIKKARNDIVHSSSPIPYGELGDQILHLKNLFIKFLETAQERFDIDAQTICEFISEVKNDLKVILSSPLNQTDVDEYLVTEGVIESKVRYKTLSYVNPVDFFVGLEFSTNIDKIFVTLEIKELENYENGQHITMNNLLKSYMQNKVSLLIVEGLAGSGKTTLSKYILSQWIQNTNLIHGLNEFTFVLYLQCNNTYINSIYDLIASIIPETSRRFEKEELIESVLCQKLLIVVDGIDEAHSGTKSVLKEFFHRSNGKNIKFFCTSRPEKVHWLYRIKGELSCGTLSIIGIAKENRMAFVKKLYTYYNNTIQSRNLCPLITVVQTLDKLSSTTISNDLKLPLFLALFTYLCTVEPRKVEGLNSVVSLYNELITALRDRLLTRALTKNETLLEPQDEDQIEETIDECFNIFCEEAFISIVESQETLSKTFLQKIRNQSIIMGLNMKDILSAFLVVKIVLTPFGIQEVVGFPHKGLKEFLAAHATVKKLRQGEKLTSILENKEEDLSTNVIRKPSKLNLDTSIIKYQNLILYLAGILVMENILKDNHVNDIIQLYRKAGAYLATEWLALLVALNFHYVACEFILMKFKKLDINDDYLDIFINLLKYNCPKEVILRVSSETNNYHKIKKILYLLNNYDCNLKLLFRYCMKHPSKLSADNLLNILNTKNSRCNLNWYEGTAESRAIMTLPQSVRVLFLGIGTKEQAKALQHLGDNSDILYLKIHIERRIESQHLATIHQEVVDFFIFLSGVKSTLNDVKWVIEVLCNLTQARRYGKILFPASSLDSKNMYKILHQLQKLKFTRIGGALKLQEEAGGIFVCSSLISNDEELELRGFCGRVFRCKFTLMTNDEIWSQ